MDLLHPEIQLNLEVQWHLLHLQLLEHLVSRQDLMDLAVLVLLESQLLQESQANLQPPALRVSLLFLYLRPVQLHLLDLLFQVVLEAQEVRVWKHRVVRGNRTIQWHQQIQDFQGFLEGQLLP